MEEEKTPITPEEDVAVEQEIPAVAGVEEDTEEEDEEEKEDENSPL